MCKGAHDIYDVIINFVGFDWQPKQVTIGLFEVIKITSQTLVNRWLNCLMNMGWKEKKLFMSKMKGQITYMKTRFN
jgi:hypothetical protein